LKFELFHRIKVDGFKMGGSTFSLASNMKDWPPKVPDMQVWWRTTYLAIYEGEYLAIS
jgi:hypothetical protein